MKKIDILRHIVERIEAEVSEGDLDTVPAEQFLERLQNEGKEVAEIINTYRGKTVRNLLDLRILIRRYDRTRGAESIDMDAQQGKFDTVVFEEKEEESSGDTPHTPNE